MENAKDCRKVMLSRELWEILGDGTSKSKRFVIRVLSLTYNSCECDRNWSSSKMVIYICQILCGF